MVKVHRTSANTDINEGYKATVKLAWLKDMK